MVLLYINQAEISNMTYPEKTRLTRRVRLTIFTTWIVFFLLISPIIILYTAGYRYNIEKKRIEQTGVISIDAEPRDAEVYINGIKLKQKMPVRLSSMMPDTYKLEIKKTGYKTWQKELNVNSKQTTYVKNIFLLLNSLPVPLLLTNEEIINLTPSPNNHQFASVFKEKNTFVIKIIDATSRKITTLDRLNSTEPPVLSWSPYGDSILIYSKQKDGYRLKLLSTENNTVNITHLLKGDGANYEWNSEFSQNPAIFFSENEQIYLLTNRGTQKIQTASSSSVWHVKNNIVWSFDNKTKELHRNKIIITSLPIENEKINKIVEINDNRIILQTDKNFLIITDYLSERKITRLNAVEKHYNKDTKEWLFWSNWELWTLYPDNQITLLNRSGGNIKKILPLDNFGVLAIWRENEISVFNPGYYLTQELFKGNLEMLSLNKEQHKMFLFGEVGKQKGLFELKYY